MRFVCLLFAAAVTCACSPSAPPAPASSPDVPSATAQNPNAEAKPPQCDDRGTLELVRQLVREQIVPGNAYRSIPQSVFDAHLTIEAVHASHFDDDVRRFECTGLLVVDSSRGVDALGKAVTNSPQLLFSAGSSIAELEQVIARDLSQDRQRFAYPIVFSSQLTNSGPEVGVGTVNQLRAFLTGSFISAHAGAVASTATADSQRESAR
jgi:hypothetical protein